MACELCGRAIAVPEEGYHFGTPSLVAGPALAAFDHRHFHFACVRSTDLALRALRALEAARSRGEAGPAPDLERHLRRAVPAHKPPEGL